MILVLAPDFPVLLNAEISNGIDLVKDILTFVPGGDTRVNPHHHEVQPPKISGGIAGGRGGNPCISVRSDRFSTPGVSQKVLKASTKGSHPTRLYANNRGSS
jgi:hypothetical protein